MHAIPPHLQDMCILTACCIASISEIFALSFTSSPEDSSVKAVCRETLLPLIWLLSTPRCLAHIICLARTPYSLLQGSFLLSTCAYMCMYVCVQVRLQVGKEHLLESLWIIRKWGRAKPEWGRVLLVILNCQLTFWIITSINIIECGCNNCNIYWGINRYLC